MLKLNSQVRIEPLKMKHAGNMCRWMSDSEVAANVGLRQKASPEKTRDWIRRALWDASIRPFAIQLDDQHVGNVVLDQIDRYLESARLSVYIGEARFRGIGVGSTAVYLAVKEGFETEHLNKIWLTVHLKNHPAVSAYTKLGFFVEGVLRDEFWLQGKRIPVFRMSLLRREFAEGQML